MLESIASKVVSAVAVIVLLGSVVGFFSIERSALEERHFRQMCESVRDAMDSLSSVNAATQLNITFGDDGPGLKLDGSFRNRPYDIEIYPGQVIFRQEGLAAVSTFIHRIHPWDPGPFGNGTIYVSAGDLEGLDAAHRALKTTSGKDIDAERRMVVVSGAITYLTFAHI